MAPLGYGACTSALGMEKDMSTGWEDHWIARDTMIAFHESVAGSNSTLIIGDSITEGFWWNTIAGYRIVNCGYGGARVEHLAAGLPSALAAAQPLYAIIMAGINNCHTGFDTSTFAPAYQAIIDLLKGKGTNVLLSSIIPVEPAKLSDPTFDQSVVNTLNHVIVDMATSQGMAMVNLNYPFMNMSTGTAYAETTVDGVHITGVSYRTLYQQWAAALSAEIARTGVTPP